MRAEEIGIKSESNQESLKVESSKKSSLKAKSESLKFSNKSSFK